MSVHVPGPETARLTWECAGKVWVLGEGGFKNDLTAEEEVFL